MKKGLSVLLVLVLCMSLAAAVGCSGGGGNGTEDDFLIGAIYINGQNDTARIYVCASSGHYEGDGGARAGQVSA